MYIADLFPHFKGHNFSSIVIIIFQFGISLIPRNNTFRDMSVPLTGHIVSKCCRIDSLIVFCHQAATAAIFQRFFCS